MDGNRILDRRSVADVVLCLGFFTRLPMPDVSPDRPFGSALWAAPLAGAVVGAIVGLVALLGLWLGLPATAAAAVALAAGIAVTGALHEDGAADVADGFGGGRTLADKLSIMRDSRIGSYGTLALILSCLGRWSAFAAVAAVSGGWMLLFTSIAAHAASRALLPGFAAVVPSARTDGLSAGLGRIDVNVAGGAALLGSVALLPLGFAYAVFAVVLLGALFLAMEALCRRQIGGQTGDVLGALQQGAEILLLLLAAALIH